MLQNSIPLCPLMSAGNDIPVVCTQERCAWYLSNVKKCSVFMIGHNVMMELKEKKDKKE